jgi:mannose-6-phosphate isomerase-like protein (cupin superfamily)
MTDTIEYNGKLIAIIISADFAKKGIHFFTADDSPQQLGYMNRPAGYVIPPHAHKPLPRTITESQEVLFIRSGKVRVDFFDDDEYFIESRVVEQGDVILIASGGHGFEIIEDAEMIEVKQGPYMGDAEKVVFSSKVNIAE